MGAKLNGEWAMRNLATAYLRRVEKCAACARGGSLDSAASDPRGMGRGSASREYAARAWNILNDAGHSVVVASKRAVAGSRCTSRHRCPGIGGAHPARWSGNVCVGAICCRIENRTPPALKKAAASNAGGGLVRSVEPVGGGESALWGLRNVLCESVGSCLLQCPDEACSWRGWRCRRVHAWTDNERACREIWTMRWTAHVTRAPASWVWTC